MIARIRRQPLYLPALPPEPPSRPAPVPDAAARLSGEHATTGESSPPDPVAGAGRPVQPGDRMRVAQNFPLPNHDIAHL
jgi:hypothetical protein